MDNNGAAIADHWKSDPYYDRVESSIGTFWGNLSVFKVRFKHLDLTHVVELACGHGRHVPQYYNQANKITLIDMNKENIDFCKKRFSDCDKINYIVNSGSDLSDIPDASATSIFSYDAMVHFELSDVATYIKEAYRILLPGGSALFHHSNNYKNPGSCWNQNPHGRNFMSAAIFKHLACRAGFRFVSQDVFDWGGSRISPTI